MHHVLFFFCFWLFFFVLMAVFSCSFWVITSLTTFHISYKKRTINKENNNNTTKQKAKQATKQRGQTASGVPARANCFYLVDAILFTINYPHFLFSTAKKTIKPNMLYI